MNTKNNTLLDIAAGQLKAFVQYPLSYSPPVSGFRHPAQGQRLLTSGECVLVMRGGLPTIMLSREAALKVVAAEDLDAAIAERSEYSYRMGWVDQWLDILAEEN